MNQPPYNSMSLSSKFMIFKLFSVIGTYAHNPLSGNIKEEADLGLENNRCVALTGGAFLAPVNTMKEQ